MIALGSLLFIGSAVLAVLVIAAAFNDPTGGSDFGRRYGAPFGFCCAGMVIGAAVALIGIVVQVAT